MSEQNRINDLVCIEVKILSTFIQSIPSWATHLKQAFPENLTDWFIKSIDENEPLNIGGMVTTIINMNNMNAQAIKKVAELDKANINLYSQITELDQTIESKDAEISRLTGELIKLQKQWGGDFKCIDELEDTIRKQEIRITDLVNDNVTMKNNLEKRRKPIYRVDPDFASFWRDQYNSLQQKYDAMMFLLKKYFDTEDFEHIITENVQDKLGNDTQELKNQITALEGDRDHYQNMYQKYRNHYNDLLDKIKSLYEDNKPKITIRINENEK